MRITTILATMLGVYATAVHAWRNDCKGSLRTLGKKECSWAMATIVDTTMYPTGTEFSRMECFLKYRSDGPPGSHNVSGAVIRKVAQDILWYCPERKGTWSTGNCKSCRVTVNFRDQGCARKFHVVTGSRFWPPWPFKTDRDRE